MSSLLYALGKNNTCLNDKKLVLLQSTINLDTFEKATKEMSAEKVTSLSKIIPMIKGIHKFMNSIDVTKPQLMHKQCTLGKQLQRQMERRFSAVEGFFILSAATLLQNPRFKTMPFSESSNIKVTGEHLVNLMRSEDAPSPAST